MITPYVASLRIYEPLEAFDGSDRSRFEQLSHEVDSKSQEQFQAIKSTIVLQPIHIDGAHVLVIENEKFISPWSTAQRKFAALEAFKSSLPESITQYFLPEYLEQSIANSPPEVSDIPHVQTETWVIPPRWFSLFTAEERFRGVSDTTAFTLMRTPLQQAIRRAEITLQTVLGAFGQGFVSQEIEDLAEWLELFHPRSWVECDYGGIATYLHRLLLERGEGGIEADTSIEDVHSSLAGLASGDGVAAGRGYERLMNRWRSVAAFEHAQ